MTSLSDLLLNEPPLRVGATAEYPVSADLIKRFMVRTRFGEVVQLYRMGDGVIHVPRAVCTVDKDKTVDNRIPGPPIAVNCTMVPRSEEQARVIAEIVAFLKAGQSGVAQCPPGFGKTVVTTKVIAELGRQTLVVVTKDDIQDQWFAAFEEFLGLGPDQVGLVRQDACRVIGKPVTVSMVHSLSDLEKYPKWIRSQFGLVVFDEVHRMNADTFREVCGIFPALLRLGLSATPSRPDGKEIIVQTHIGPVRVVSQQMAVPFKALLMRSDWKCPRWKKFDKKTQQWVLRKADHSPTKCGHVIKALCEDDQRNGMLARAAYAAYLKGRKTVLFSDSLDHLDRLKQMLLVMGLPQENLGLYTGAVKKGERDAVKKRMMILATYGMMSEGTDNPALDTCILGTPRAKVEQIVGRIRREHEKLPAVVIDVQDDDSPVFANYAKSRRKWYQSQLAEVKAVSA